MDLAILVSLVVGGIGLLVLALLAVLVTMSGINRLEDDQ